jgi:hypothetical protein
MPHKNRILAILLLAFSTLAIFSFSALAQANNSTPAQVSLSDIGNATVTLYYYDNASGTRGDMVPMAGNPQQVNNDPGKAAPGMYVFPRVPAGSWYYLEADNNGNKWYTIFYMEENIGTKTANVDIPPLTPLNTTAESPSPAPLHSISPTAGIITTPVPVTTGIPKATPGMTMPAVIAIFLVITILKRR